MVKKIAALTFAVFAAAGFLYAVEMEFATEVKTGVFWDSWARPEARMHHNYDAGVNQGTFKLDMRFRHENLGARVRFVQEAWVGAPSIQWEFAYAYGGFLAEQLRFSAGRLGSSPWEWGGSLPRWIWVPGNTMVLLDSSRIRLEDQIGLRAEIMPRAVPGLNIGFVLNQWDNSQRQPRLGPDWAEIPPPPITLRTLLMESVIGVAYTNDHFHGRFSIRLDSDADDVFNPWAPPPPPGAPAFNRTNEGMQLMYRLEARFLGNLVEDLSVWANGWWRGIGADIDGLGEGSISFDVDSLVDWRNWLYIEYAPADFIAELRLGAQLSGLDLGSHILTVRPSFYYNIFPFLRAGAAFRYEHNIGADAGIKGEPLHFFAFEPEVRIHFGSTYMAFVYGFENRFDNGDRSARHWINLRTVISF